MLLSSISTDRVGPDHPHAIDVGLGAVGSDHIASDHHVAHGRW